MENETAIRNGMKSKAEEAVVSLRGLGENNPVLRGDSLRHAAEQGYEDAVDDLPDLGCSVSGCCMTV